MTANLLLYLFIASQRQPHPQALHMDNVKLSMKTRQMRTMSDLEITKKFKHRLTVETRC